jgi:hypothetical protein
MTTTTTTSTLSNRYIEATLRHLPGHQRSDIDRELRTSIADAVDDRVQAGADRAEAEVAVLTELGDPERLAAGYAERPLHLIGPALYLDYVRLLRTLLGVVLPVVTLVVVIVQIAEKSTVGHIIGSTISTVITTGVHIAFWTTLVFVILERTRAHEYSLSKAWTPEMLPEPPRSRARFGELVALTTFTVAFSALILLSPIITFKKDAAGNGIGPLSPWLWDNGVVYIFVALVMLSLCGVFAKYYRPRSVPLGLGSLVVDLAAPVLLIWLASHQRILNPAFTTAFGWSAGVVHGIQLGLIIGATLGLLNTLFEGIRRLVRSRQSQVDR